MLFKKHFVIYIIFLACFIACAYKIVIYITILVCFVAYVKHTIGKHGMESCPA